MYAYTRKEALADGVLIDVTEQAKESGFKIPTAVTDHLYHRYISPPTGLEDEVQPVSRPLHDLFTMTKAAASVRSNDNRTYFNVQLFIGNRNLKQVRSLVIISSNKLLPTLNDNVT